MSRVFDENIECTELILRIILDKPYIKVSEVHTQREIKNLLGHSVRLDIDARDVDDEPIDVEIQRSDKGAGVKPARYNSSMMDANKESLAKYPEMRERLQNLLKQGEKITPKKWKAKEEI